MPRVNSTLPHGKLLEILSYDGLTGEFISLKKRNKLMSKKPFGSLSEHGYWKIGADGHQYYAHRLAWFYVHGAWPKGVIDHIDRNRLNNKIENLRDVTQVENGFNKDTKNPLNKSCGLIGVHYHRQQKKWCAQIKHLQRKIYLGLHETPEIAQAAYLEAKNHIAEHGFYVSPWKRKNFISKRMFPTVKQSLTIENKIVRDDRTPDLFPLTACGQISNGIACTTPRCGTERICPDCNPWRLGDGLSAEFLAQLEMMP
jgi:hypothetical protein